MREKQERDPNWLFNVMKRAREELGTPIAKRYYVVEFKPGTRYHDGYDYTWSRDSRRRVSPYFETEEEAKTWAEKYEPDEGAEFIFESQTLYERTVRSWH